MGPADPFKYYETLFKLPFCINNVYEMPNPSIQKKKLTKNSRSVQLRSEKLPDGSIAYDTNPKRIWESEAILRAHKLTNFRTCLNNLRKPREVCKLSSTSFISTIGITYGAIF